MITCEDNMELMARYEDNYFDLAIVDPPYGIGYENGGQYFNKNQGKKWDKNTPNKEYFNELFRVSKNQIIWGGNYFNLQPTRCVLAWTKTRELQNRTFSEWEMAWSCFNSVARYYNLKPFQRNGTRIHPTQKPVKLYEWLLMNYAKEGDKILDTHLGSGSIAIACHNLGFDLTACELDPDYYEAAMKRIEQHKNQQRLF
jgi:site-specific DNA-methyltransferase (adenine-specific)